MTPGSAHPGTTGERLQAALLRLLLAGLGMLPLDTASALGGTLGRWIGPRLGVSVRAYRNLDLALPELGVAAHRAIVLGMWTNLGRVLAEYAHLARLRCFGEDGRVKLVGAEHVEAARAAGRTLIIFSGHFGNWEIGGLAAAQYGLDVAQIYRAANNPAVEAMMLALRRSLKVEPISKGASGARRIIGSIKAGRTLMMLIDQKMNDGIAVPFFGHPAMTAPAVAELALRYDAALLPARVERLQGAHFRVTVEPAMSLPHSGDRQADILALMTGVNSYVEACVRAAPEQWFWLHRRWKK